MHMCSCIHQSAVCTCALYQAGRGPICRAKDYGSQLASAWRLVQVQQHYTVSLTLPLRLTAASTAEAQTQADVLMTGSNATGTLAAALSAGLTSGEVYGSNPTWPSRAFVLCVCVNTEAVVLTAVGCDDAA